MQRFWSAAFRARSLRAFSAADMQTVIGKMAYTNFR
jgi:hypothetical protein